MLAQSPLWAELLESVQTQISGGRQIKGSGPASLQGTASALARAHSELLVAAEGGSSIRADSASRLATEAVGLVLAVAGVWATFGERADGRRARLAEQLRQRLSSHEDAVLAGEVTYCVWSEQAEQPAARMRQAIARLSRNPTTASHDLLSLRAAAVDLASLLIRLAANAAASGRAGEAPEARSAGLHATLSTLTAELEARAQELEHRADERTDIVVHHLAAGLRVRVSQDTLRAIAANPPDRSADPVVRGGLRDAWLHLATHEYAAVSALATQRNESADDHRRGGLASTIGEQAAHVICGARLVGRPGAFRHRRAWRNQATALTYALEAYVAGLRGHAPSLAQAHLITLTRLVRATVAIAAIDLPRADTLRSNGNPQTMRAT